MLDEYQIIRIEYPVSSIQYQVASIGHPVYGTYGVDDPEGITK
jgi:hypothetical protein